MTNRVVTIAKKDLNIELDDYIEKRRGEDSYSIGETLGRIKGSFSERKITLPSLGIRNMFRRRIPEEKEYVEETPEEKEEFKEMEEELEHIQEAEDELEEKREGILKNFFKKLWYSGGRSYEEEDTVLEEEQTSQTEEETREVLKSLHKWLESLPADKKSEFKKSEDFQKYKELLEKLGMIK